ncbi:HNH endonuclease signature motif containing protein [Sedimentibacter sp.]|uniref:HNH endonuclease n=1 Tax=Sedimentibacter sp. TaxID=1960295 RepID=UPI00289BD662|nr:HNH endonuclease signature motif containing protein [Sedimentibacter sp.]
MKKINKPQINQSEIFDAFKDLKYKDILEQKSIDYASNFEELIALYNFENKKIDDDIFYKPYMKKMYSERFSQKGYPEVYKYYLQIRQSVGYCPYCNFPTHHTKQIDHYFPKAIFPSLSLTVDNLVPICTDCNKTKWEYYSLNKNEMLIHPYYDEFANDSFEFIHCNIIEEEHIGFTFSIKKLEKWDDTIFERVKIHFKILELDKLYSSDFETDFSVYIEELKELYIDCDEADVKEILKRKIRSYRKSNIKPWFYAGYNSILNNAWFFEYYIKI